MGVGVAVGVFSGVAVCVGVGLTVTGIVGVKVLVAVAELVAVAVAVRDAVAVAVLVEVAVLVRVAVFVAVAVAVAVLVEVFVDVRVAVRVAVEVAVEVGGIIPSRAARARSSWMRGLVTVPPGRVSGIETPVDVSAARIWSIVAPGAAERSRAKAPATCGDAIDVPSQVSNPPPGTDELAEEPGAKSVKKEATFEKGEMTFESIAEPTLTEEEMQAGAASAFV